MYRLSTQHIDIQHHFIRDNNKQSSHKTYFQAQVKILMWPIKFI